MFNIFVFVISVYTLLSLPSIFFDCYPIDRYREKIKK